MAGSHAALFVTNRPVRSSSSISKLKNDRLRRACRHTIRHFPYPIDIGYGKCLILVEFVIRRADQRGEGSG